jgi:hypothetical protein
MTSSQSCSQLAQEVLLHTQICLFAQLLMPGTHPKCKHVAFSRAPGWYFLQDCNQQEYERELGVSRHCNPQSALQIELEELDEDVAYRF